MNVINTLTNQVEARISGGQSSQALVYVPNAVPAGEGQAHLDPLGEAGLSAHLMMGSPGTATGDAPTTVTLNNQGLIDLLQAAVTGLKPNAPYLLALTADQTDPKKNFLALARFKTNPAGAAIVNTLGPLRRVVVGPPGLNERRYLVIVPEAPDGESKPVQIQLE
jgi:hypothetical protein